MTSPQLPIDHLPDWARLNGIELLNARVDQVEGKGWGLLYTSDAVTENSTVLRVPRDLVLSAEAVDDFGKIDQNFRKLLNTAGYEVNPDNNFNNYWERIKTTIVCEKGYFTVPLRTAYKPRAGPASFILSEIAMDNIHKLPRSRTASPNTVVGG